LSQIKLAKSNELAAVLLSEKIIELKNTLNKKSKLTLKKRNWNNRLLDLYGCLANDLKHNFAMTYSKRELELYLKKNEKVHNRFKRDNLESEKIWNEIKNKKLSNSDNLIKLNELVSALSNENHVNIGCGSMNSERVELLNRNDTIYLKSNGNYKFEVRLLNFSPYNEFTDYPHLLKSINGKKKSIIEINTYGLTDTTINYPIQLKGKDTYGDLKSFVRVYYFQVVN